VGVRVEGGTTCFGVRDETVQDAIELITSTDSKLRELVKLARVGVLLVSIHENACPESEDDQFSPVHCGCSGNNTVIVARVTLG
jgi:hypothetical protein